MDWFYNLKKNGTPTIKQWKQYIITFLIIGFIIGFNDKNSTGLGAQYIKNMIISISIVAFSIGFSNFINHIFTAILGYKSQYNFSINGLLIGIMLAFVSNGFFWYFSPGYHIINMSEKGRMGYFRYGLRMRDWSRAAVAGVYAYMFLALIAYISARGNPLIDLFVKINIFLAFYSMLPIPENNGLNILFGQRSLYFFTLSGMIAIFLAMKFLNNFFLIILIGFIFAIFGTIFWFTQFEK